jgi:hypothetical protein
MRVCCAIFVFYHRVVPCSDILIFLPFCCTMHLFSWNIVLYPVWFLCYHM